MVQVWHKGGTGLTQGWYRVDIRWYRVSTRWYRVDTRVVQG